MAYSIWQKTEIIFDQYCGIIITDNITSFAHGVIFHVFFIVTAVYGSGIVVV